MNPNKDIYAILKTQKNNIAGKIDSINNGRLIYKPLTEDLIPLWSFHHIDVFNSRSVYFKNLSVLTTTEDKIKPEKILFRKATRKIQIRYLNTELTSFIEGIIAI